MKLYRPSEVPEDSVELICRESRLAGVIRLIIFSVILAVPVIYGWRFNHPWVLALGVVLLIVVIPVVALDVAAQFRPTNWLLRITPKGMWINLNSFRNKPSDAVSVLWLGYEEIASVSRHGESYSTPSERAGPYSRGRVGGDTMWHDEFLEIRLNGDQTSELQTALNHLRSPSASSSAPQQFRKHHISVWLAGPSVLRITWYSGHGHVVAPRIGPTLAQLETYVRRAEPTHRKRPNWRQLTAQDVNELARELVHVHGTYSEAVDLLVRAGGNTSADAWKLIQQFEREAVNQWAHHPQEPA